MSERVLLKLGGSVVTEKGAEGVIAEDALRRIAREISLRKHHPLIVVHGAGSCGHPEAHRFGIDKGVKRENMEGVYQTHRAVSRLNMAVVDALRDAGVEAIGIHPLDACIAEEGRLASCMHTHLCLMTDIGIMPVLHGDVVMDNSRGACIVSGDPAHPLSRPLDWSRPRRSRDRCARGDPRGKSRSRDNSRDCGEVPDWQVISYRCHRWHGGKDRGASRARRRGNIIRYLSCGPDWRFPR